MTFKDYIKEDKEKCEFLSTRKTWFRVRFLHEHEYIIWKFQRLLRKEEYYAHKGNYVLSTLFRIRKNILGQKLGFTIHKDVFGPGLRIWHYGYIVVNANARVGKNCILHGNNCIGNNGLSNGNPTIGDNVEFGVGACAIGDITIGNNVIIGAGAVVNKNFPEGNCILAGIPAKIIKKI